MKSILCLLAIAAVTMLVTSGPTHDNWQIPCNGRAIALEALCGGDQVPAASSRAEGSPRSGSPPSQGSAPRTAAALRPGVRPIGRLPPRPEILSRSGSPPIAGAPPRPGVLSRGGSPPRAEVPPRPGTPPSGGSPPRAGAAPRPETRHANNTAPRVSMAVGECEFPWAISSVGLKETLCGNPCEGQYTISGKKLSTTGGCVGLFVVVLCDKFETLSY